ncbi:hypothetical protein AAEX28_10460 [Lentisphaerota bacterium WC36G]|nr:hypothetical protein LJT99_13305 [Lentisphaerae bacterium WC36]
MNENAKVKALAICYYVVGWLQLGTYFVLAMSILFFNTPEPSVAITGGADGPASIYITVNRNITIGFWCLVLMGFMTIFNGICIRQNRLRTYSMIIAIFYSLLFPLGTILAIFSFIVLFNNEVNKLYFEKKHQVEE